MDDAIVIGGGILGSSVAWRLAEAGMRVTLLEAQGLGQGASNASFAWLNGSAQSDKNYFHLKVDALNAYRSLERELGHTPWLHLDGHIEWNAAANETLDARGFDGLPTADRGITGQERLRNKAQRLRDWGFTVELLPGRELKGLEPGLRVPNDVEEFAFYPQEGYIEPVPAIGAFVAEARRHRARIVTGAPVSSILLDGDRVRGVVTGQGDRYLSDTVVVCAGSRSGEMLRMAGIDLPMSPADGVVAVSGPSAARLRAVLHTESLSLRPDGGGRIMMRNHAFDRLVDATMPPAQVPDWTGDLLARATALLPDLADTRIEAVRAATRPIPGDGFPVVGAIPNVSGLYAMVAHGAVTLASILGPIAAREIAHGEPDPRLDAFRPDRLIRAS